MKHVRYLLIGLLSLFCISLNAYYYGQNKVNATYTRWSQIETMHFDIYFPKGYDNFGRIAALMAENTYYYLKNDFQFPAISRIPIIFYGSQLEFQTTNIIYPLLSEGIGGFTESYRNRVVIPFDGSYAKLEQLLTHELTHAYINALDYGSPGSFFYLKNFNFPFWFSEGLPEFQSVGGADINNNAFMLDLVINDKLRPLSEASGYSAYRMGEAFLVFLHKRYGRDKVMDFFYTLRSLNDIDKAAQKVFGMKFDELESRWRNQLKRDYFPFIQSHTIPSEYSRIKTNHKEDGSYFNLAPRFSPDGQNYLYFSNKDARFSIWTGGIFDSTPNKKLITGESTGKMEEFHYLRSTFAWFPDGKQFAYVAKTSFGDKICIADYQTNEIIKQISLPQMKAIYELDIAPDGENCVFSGQKDMQSDLFLYNFKTTKLDQLTNDSYSDAQPRFSPDGKTIAYASERAKAEEQFRKGFFSNLRSNLYVYSIQNNSLTQITNDNFNCTHPVWDSTGTKLVFISEKDSVPNLELIDLNTSQRAPITKTLSGIYSFDINQNKSNLVYSCYYEGGWDIFIKNEPFDSLNYSDYTSPQLIENTDSLLDNINLSRLDYFGKRNKQRVFTDGGPKYINNHATVIDFHPETDTVKVKHDFSWDNEPDSITVIPQIKPYKLKLVLDRFWGGFAYSSSVGTIGSIELGLSDFMGNHAFGINLAMAGKIKDSNILLTYLYLPHRTDYGIGVFNIFDEYNADTIYYEKIRASGLYNLVRYPLNKFFRLDFESQIYSWEYESIFEHENDLILAPAVTLVHDNTLYGSTGPMLGWRAFVTLRNSFALHKNDYQTAYMDLRSYTLFNKRYSIALRLVGGISGGNEPQNFGLDGYYGIRGYEGDEIGRKISMATAELRAPFFDYIAMPFPLPLTITSLRGSVFADLGGVWNDDNTFRGMQNNRLRDLKLGFGYGPRLNIGFAVLRFDIAWLTDLVQTSKPTFYLSLTEDF